MKGMGNVECERGARRTIARIAAFLECIEDWIRPRLAGEVRDSDTVVLDGDGSVRITNDVVIGIGRCLSADLDNRNIGVSAVVLVKMNAWVRSQEEESLIDLVTAGA